MKVIVKRTLILATVAASVISNTYILYLNNTYKIFYSSMADTISITGIVVSEPIQNEYNYQYTISGTSEKYKNKRFLLYVKKDEKALLEYGDVITVHGEFSIPEPQRNYKGFNYREYLKTKKVYGIIFVSYQDIKVIDKNKGSPLIKLSNNMRNSIIKNANEILPQKTAGLLIGILLGDKSDISEELIQNFNLSSLSHILAVSRSTYYIHSFRSSVHLKQK